MRAANPWKSYRETATLTAPPGQIVLMLFEGAIRSLERSLPGFSTTDPGEANMIIHNNLQRAQEIIRELNDSLNMDQGGEFAANMRRLYDYLERRIWESNIKKNSTGVGEAIRHLTVLRDAWATMLNNQGSPDPAATLAAA
ncbi:MAG TPA: flagellar export chaperone FliS [Verrucomicrobiae bacterium]|nr:flagellar export chaperone FliS [Verrucomicrobiae bacterium]